MTTSATQECTIVHAGLPIGRATVRLDGPSRQTVALAPPEG